MKDISIYFSPVSTEFIPVEGTIGAQIGAHFEGHFPAIEKGGIALVYVPEFRNGAEQFHKSTGDDFRKHLYSLFVGFDWSLPLYDCGTILPGKEIDDTYYAVSQVTAELVKNQIIPIIIGGTQDLTYALYKGYEKLEQLINICSVDHKLDLGDPDKAIHKDGYLSHLLTHRPCFLFNHSNIGCQNPFVSKLEMDLFEKLYFDNCRLGEFNADFKKAEPYLRNADILSLDLQSIRSSDFPGIHYSSPNGFYAEQICQISKYAGISDKLTSFGIFNLFPEGNQPVLDHLVAQIIWYFIEGVSQRKGDFPVGNKKEYTKFSVHLDDFAEEIIFYKSNKSERWWMEVPYPNSEDLKYDRHHLIPCDHNDYQKAMNNEIPNLWWKTYQKLV
jgi:formiminoglutamase